MFVGLLLMGQGVCQFVANKILTNSQKTNKYPDQSTTKQQNTDQSTTNQQKPLPIYNTKNPMTNQKQTNRSPDQSTTTHQKHWLTNNKPKNILTNQQQPNKNPDKSKSNKKYPYQSTVFGALFDAWSDIYLFSAP